MWVGSVVTVGPPVNLWTAGTIGRHFALSVHCVMFVPVMSSVSLFSKQKCLSHPINEHQESYSDTSSMMSQSVTFSPYSHTAKCTLMQFSTNKPNTF